MSDLGEDYPHRRWGIGKRCEAGAVGEWGPEVEGNCKSETDTETELAVDTAKMLDGILQSLSLDTANTL